MSDFGYARVSTTEQNLDLQQTALTVAGCRTVFTDQGVSGADFARPGLTKLLKKLRPGDRLTVWRLDRLGRSLFELIRLVRELDERGVEFRSLSESIDTSTSGGRLLFHLLASMAEFERSLVSERTKAGMEAARARGSRIGRRPALNTEQLREARAAVAANRTIAEVAGEYQVHPRTLSRLLRRSTAETEAPRP